MICCPCLSSGLLLPDSVGTAEKVATVVASASAERSLHLDITKCREYHQANVWIWPTTVVRQFGFATRNLLDQGSGSSRIIGVHRERRRWMRSLILSPSRLASTTGSSLSFEIASPTTLSTPTGPRGPSICAAMYVPHFGQIRKSAVLCPNR